jgi:hypothetical protein
MPWRFRLLVSDDERATADHQRHRDRHDAAFVRNEGRRAPGRLFPTSE